MAAQITKAKKCQAYTTQTACNGDNDCNYDTIFGCQSTAALSTTCSQYNNCRECAANGCVWDKVNARCKSANSITKTEFDRNHNLVVSANLTNFKTKVATCLASDTGSSSSGTSNSANSCSDYTSCRTCTPDDNCTWCAGEKKCINDTDRTTCTDQRTFLSECSLINKTPGGAESEGDVKKFNKHRPLVDDTPMDNYWKNNKDAGHKWREEEDGIDDTDDDDDDKGKNKGKGKDKDKNKDKDDDEDEDEDEDDVHRPSKKLSKYFKGVRIPSVDTPSWLWSDDDKHRRKDKNKKTACTAQGKEYKTAFPTQECPDLSDYVRKDTLPDMSQYIRKDSIPCWNCSLP